MQIDAEKFMNMVIEKTNQKLNALQAQVIVLETQLALAVDSNSQLQKQIQALNQQIETGLNKADIKEKQSSFT